MAMTGPGRLSTSSTRATDFSRPTSNGATAAGNSTALRMGKTGSSSPNWISSSERGGMGGGGGFFFSDMGSPWCELLNGPGAHRAGTMNHVFSKSEVRLGFLKASTDFSQAKHGQSGVPPGRTPGRAESRAQRAMRTAPGGGSAASSAAPPWSLRVLSEGYGVVPGKG